MDIGVRLRGRAAPELEEAVVAASKFAAVFPTVAGVVDHRRGTVDFEH